MIDRPACLGIEKGYKKRLTLVLISFYFNFLGIQLSISFLFISSLEIKLSGEN